MKMRSSMAIGLACALAMAALTTSTTAGAQTTVTLSGTAKKEAKKPFIEYSVRARNAQGGDITGTTPLDVKGDFSLTAMPPAHYVLELLNKDGKVVCTEGPYDLTRNLLKDDADISCNTVPVAWWLLGVAAAAGVTAGVVVSTASPSQ